MQHLNAELAGMHEAWLSVLCFSEMLDPQLWLLQAQNIQQDVEVQKLKQQLQNLEVGCHDFVVPSAAQTTCKRM